MSLLDQIRHESVEEGEHESSDVSTIYIGICHDDYLVITQLCYIKSSWIPVPNAVIMALISALSYIRSSLAFSTFSILPRRGKIACVARLLAVFAEPPAESPSTMKISQFLGSLSEQSASLPGRVPPSRDVFLLVRSLAFLAASLALCAKSDFSQIFWLHQDSARGNM